jgi:2-oxoglutarate/2-oxoacid ferredoxin oxidoreductase subunit beta
VDILQPCVSFNKVNTFAWYKQRVYEIPANHDPTNRSQAMAVAQEFGERIPIGVIYRNEHRSTFESHFSVLKEGPLFGRTLDKNKLQQIMESYC